MEPGAIWTEIKIPTPHKVKPRAGEKKKREFVLLIAKAMTHVHIPIVWEVVTWRTRRAWCPVVAVGEGTGGLGQPGRQHKPNPPL